MSRQGATIEHKANRLAASERRGDLQQILKGPFQIQSVTLTLLLGVAIACVLRFTRGLFLPIALAMLVHFVLEPLVRLLRAAKIPAPAGAAIVLLILLGVSGYGLYLVYTPALEMVKEMPRTLQKVEGKLSALKGPVEQVKRASEQVADITSFPAGNDDPVVRLQEPGIAGTLISNLSELIAGSVLGLALAYFLLANEGVFLHRVAALLTGATEQAVAQDGVRRIQEQISTYLLTITAVNAGFGLVVGLMMYAAGMPNPVLWGVMAGVLTFVPYLGPATGVAIVTVVALVSFESLGRALLPPMLYVIAAVLEGMIITPMVLGYRLTLSPVAIFLWLVLLNWLWGIPGAVIAVPMLVVVKILCDNMRSLEAVGRLLER